MTFILMILLLMAGAILQTLSPAYAILGQVKIPIILSFVIYYALNRNTNTMLIAALLAGIIQDSLSLSPLGYSSAIFIIVGWLISQYQGIVMADSFMTSVIFGAIAGTAVTLMHALLLAHGGLINIIPFLLLLRMLGSGFLCALITPLVFLLTKTLDQAVGNINTRGDSREIY
jgi:rod shape-determining protein MreD